MSDEKKSPFIIIPCLGRDGLEHHRVENTPDAIARFKAEWLSKQQALANFEQLHSAEFIN